MLMDLQMLMGRVANHLSTLVASHIDQQISTFEAYQGFSLHEIRDLDHTDQLPKWSPPGTVCKNELSTIFMM